MHKVDLGNKNIRLDLINDIDVDNKTSEITDNNRIERIIVDQDHSIEMVFKCKDAIEDALMIAEEGDAV